ncbi:hypothetical protein ES703_120526 [subsurface metagenome]
MEHLQDHRQFPRIKRPRAAELIKQLGQFDGSGAQFFVNLLAVQCFLGQADSGAILANNEQKGVDVLAIYPALRGQQTAPEWLNQSAELMREATSTDAVIVKGLPAVPEPRLGRLDAEENDNRAARSYVVLVPLKMADIGQAMEAFVVRTNDRDALEASKEQLELTE